MARKKTAKQLQVDAILEKGIYKANRQELELVYRVLAKRADERLVRLERLDKGMREWAYGNAMLSIENYSGPKKKQRFNRKPPEADKLLRMKIKDIQVFLGAGTSTKIGIKTKYQKQAETTMSKWKKDYNIELNLDWTAWAHIWESGLGDLMSGLYGSETAVVKIDQLLKWKGRNHQGLSKKNIDNIVKKVNSAKRDATKDRRLKKWLSEHGLTGEVDIDSL